MQDTVVQTLETILENSSATPEFKSAVNRLASGSDQTAIRFTPGNPPVKVLRFVMKLLESHPGIPFESLLVDAQAGCSDYVGRATAQPGNVQFEFEWDCLWKAEQMGWTDAFGDPDQIRAARTYGYQCFRSLSQK